MTGFDLACENCGSHFVLSPGNSLDGAITNGLSCPECGGKRFFRDQPSPTQSEGMLRDMVDSDTQKDQGGNPLGEGTIMGTDGEKPAFKRDNFMHSRVGAPLILQRQAAGFSDPFLQQVEELQNQYHRLLEEGLHEEARQIFYKLQELQNHMELHGTLPGAQEQEQPDPWKAAADSWMDSFVDPRNGQAVNPYVRKQIHELAGTHYTRSRVDRKAIGNWPEAYKQAWINMKGYGGADEIRNAVMSQGPTAVDFGSPSDYQHPDPWMDSEPGSLTFPQHWGRKSVMDKTFNMEPYEMDGLFDLPPSYHYQARQAGLFGDIWNGVQDAAKFLPGAAETAAGAVGDAIPGVDFGPSEALTAEGLATLGEEGAAAAAGDVAENGASSMAQKALGTGLDKAKQIGVSQIKNQAMNQIKQHLPNSLPSVMKGALGVGAGGAAGAAAGGANAGAGGAPVGQDSQFGIQQFTPQMGLQASIEDIPMALVSALETSDSVKQLDTQSDDPEDQDQKEFNDRDRSPSNHLNPNNQDSGASGEDGVREKSEGYGFGPDSPGIDRAMMMLPLLLHYYQSEESGENDPLIRGLHDLLEQENPGYLKSEHPDGHELVKTIIQLHKPTPPAPQHHGAIPGMIDPQQMGAMAPGMNVPPGHQPNQVGSRCPTCGGVTNPDGSCPQCGTPAQQPALPSTPPRTGNSIGPATPEQKALVIQYLVDHDRGNEAPNVEMHPEQYAQELSDIVGQPNNVPPIPDPSQVTPLQAQPAPPGGAPVPDPGAANGPASGAPMQPMSAYKPVGYPDPEDYIDDEGVLHARGYPAMSLDADLAAKGIHPSDRQRDILDENIPYPGAGDWGISQFGRPNDPPTVVGVPNPAVVGPGTPEPLWRQLQNGPGRQGRTADANARVPRCPKCHSGSTTLVIGDDNDMPETRGRCHSCGNIWELSGQDQDASEIKHYGADSVAPRCPKCGSGSTGLRQSGGDDGLTAECNSCHNIWDVSDKIDINKYKGASLQLKGLVDLPNPALQQDEPQIVWKDTEGNDLVPGTEYEISSAAFPVPTYAKLVHVAPEHTSWKISGGVASQLNPDENQPDFTVKRKEAQLNDYHFTPIGSDSDMDDRNTEPPQGSTTPGEAHIPPSGPTTDELSNSYPNTTVSRLSTSEVDNHDEIEPEEDDHCRKCGSTTVDSTMRDEVTTFHQCVPCGHAWETKDEWQGREASVDLSWLLDNSGPGGDDFWDNMDRARAMREADRGTQSRSLSSIVAKDPVYQRIHETLETNAQRRVAGRHFTPSEKRDLINERGSARNLEDLDLANTHYEIRDDYTGKANGLNVREDDLFLGI